MCAIHSRALEILCQLNTIQKLLLIISINRNYVSYDKQITFNNNVFLIDYVFKRRDNIYPKLCLSYSKALNIYKNKKIFD